MLRVIDGGTIVDNGCRVDVKEMTRFTHPHVVWYRPGAWSLFARGRARVGQRYCENNERRDDEAHNHDGICRHDSPPFAGDDVMQDRRKGV